MSRSGSGGDIETLNGLVVNGLALLEADARTTGAGSAILFNGGMRVAGDRELISNGGNIELNDVQFAGSSLFARTDNGDGTAIGGDLQFGDVTARDAGAALSAELEAITNGGTISIRQVGSAALPLLSLTLDADGNAPLDGTIIFTGTSYEAQSLLFSADQFQFDTFAGLDPDPVLGRVVSFGDSTGTTRTGQIFFTGGSMDIAGLDLLILNALGQSALPSDVIQMVQLSDSDGGTGSVRIRANERVRLNGTSGDPLDQLFVATDSLDMNGADFRRG